MAPKRNEAPTPTDIEAPTPTGIEAPTPTGIEAPTPTDIVRTRSLKSNAPFTFGPQEFTYGGGPLIRAAKVFTIFWGSHWNEDPLLKTQMQNLNDFFDFIFAEEELIEKLKEYSVPRWKITRGERLGTADEMILQSLGADIRIKGLSVTDEQIKQMLIGVNKQFRENNVENNPNLLYFVYLPPKVKLVRGTQESCKDFCGYHSHINKKIFYAAVPYPDNPDCEHCKGDLAPFDALTLTSSHELWEAITDPIPPKGWYDNQRGEEICDGYEWKREDIKRYSVQFLPEKRMTDSRIIELAIKGIEAERTRLDEELAALTHQLKTKP